MKFIELKLESTCGLVSALSTEGETGMVIAPKRLSPDCMQEPRFSTHSEVSGPATGSSVGTRSSKKLQWNWGRDPAVWNVLLKPEREGPRISRRSGLPWEIPGASPIPRPTWEKQEVVHTHWNLSSQTLFLPEDCLRSYLLKNQIFFSALEMM